MDQLHHTKINSKFGLILAQLLFDRFWSFSFLRFESIKFVMTVRLLNQYFQEWNALKLAMNIFSVCFYVHSRFTDGLSIRTHY